MGFVPFGKPRDGDPVDVGIKLFGVRHKNRGERGAAVSADVKPARIVFIVVHIGEIRHGSSPHAAQRMRSKGQWAPHVVQ